ncbi:phosphatase PAP2 family protein [Paraburkholderia bonniea]|uniref:acid phosphatase n=1 Tax=Paraburkholderia bonniea TaxID=2152891 RepID=UPI0025735BC5|nr:phosphatase PAP2 family protein [Paraburkholderia bonniea]WJF91120.1 phosphatase PAP2 family protein [Paraburkholderia bonniea]WJF94435.1 phosphatase PAP2 family protein [Paraburkholderia bonniea]
MKIKVKIALLTVIAASFYSAALLAAGSDGFLTAETAPSSLAILPPPPAENTVAFLNDKANYEIGRSLKNDTRVALAASDANCKNINAIFSSAFGREISEEKTPKLYRLLLGVLQDSHDHAMKSAKNHYMRVRPFVMYGDKTCTPEEDNKMKNTGSYPSGHASFGWAAALVLSEINPERTTEILRRGYDFGQSRVVCGAHWQSDVDNGRLMGAAVVADLHNNDKFIKALEAAKAEFKENTPGN